MSNLKPIHRHFRSDAEIAVSKLGKKGDGMIYSYDVDDINPSDPENEVLK